MTTVYLIRHSVRMPMALIESYNTKQNDILKYEKIILSTLGEERAKILSKQKELENIDVVYTSNCVRTLQTAKYLLEKQNLKVNIDERFDERRVGQRNEDDVTDWFSRQYFDADYKTIGGESQNEVCQRFNEAFFEVIDKNKNKRIAIYTHGYAITFFLLKYCKLLEIDGKRLKFEYKGKVLFDKEISAPEVFKLLVDENTKEVVDIKLLEFDDLPFNCGI